MSVHFLTPVRWVAAACLISLGIAPLAQDLAIVDARIVAGGGLVIERGTVIVRGGRIVEVAATAAVPSGMRTVTGVGLTLYPGFIDAYCTRGLKLPDPPTPEARPSVVASAPNTMWAKNRTGIRARVDAVSCLDLADIMKDAHGAGFTAALLCPGSGLIRGRAATVFLTDGNIESRPFGFGMSFRGVGGGPPGGGGGGQNTPPPGYPGTMMGLYAHLRQILNDAGNSAMVGQNGSLDPDLDATRRFLEGRELALVAADTELDIVRAVRLAEEFGYPLAIAGGREAYTRASWLAQKKIPVLVGLNVGVRPSTTPDEDGPPKEVLEERAALWDERAANVVGLHRAGVDFALSSEGDTYPSFLANVRAAIGRGLPASAALEAMTSVPARLLGLAAHAGSVTVGKRGDFVLMSGPFESADSKVVMVVVGGKVFEASKEAAR